MLNQGNSNILKQGNKETLEGYPSIKLANFWNNYKDRVKQKLFIELKDNPQYEPARQTVLTYFEVSTYEELISKTEKAKKKLKEDKQIVKELKEAIEMVDKEEYIDEGQRKRA